MHHTFNTIIENLTQYVKDLKDTGIEEIYVAQPQSVASLTKIAAKISSCNACGLHQTRHKTVPGEGSCSPELMFIGEAPGADEDKQGIPFVGRAGQLLTRLITALGMTRSEVFIGNILKCRPPDNRNPQPKEIEACLPFLIQQIEILQPKVIVTLGATALTGLLGQGPDFKISHVRGTWLEFHGIPLMPTYHPSYLLRNPSAKRDVWQDMLLVLQKLGRQPPSRAT